MLLLMLYSPHSIIFTNFVAVPTLKYCPTRRKHAIEQVTLVCGVVSVWKFLDGAGSALSSLWFPAHDGLVSLPLPGFRLPDLSTPALLLTSSVYGATVRQPCL